MATLTSKIFAYCTIIGKDVSVENYDDGSRKINCIECLPNQACSRSLQDYPNAQYGVPAKYQPCIFKPLEIRQE